MVFNEGYTSKSLGSAYLDEWATHALLPSHLNINRFLCQFKSSVPDEMFEALTDAQKASG